MKIFFFILGIFLFTNSLKAQVNVQAALSNNRIFIGDQIKLNIDVTYPSGWEIETIVPDTIKQVGLEFSMPKNEDFWATHHYVTAGMEYKTSITLQAFEPDTVDIPPIAVLLSHDGKMDTAYTIPLTLMVFPLKLDSTQVAAPIKDIIREPKSLEDDYIYIIIVLLILISIGIGYYFYQKKMRQAIKITDVQKFNLTERTLNKLKTLESQKLWEQAKYNEFCTELSYILRSFLEEEYKIQALESPTSYIILDLEKQKLTQRELIQWKELLLKCDTVKFANSTEENTFYENAILKAKHLING